ncbi:hypothetical protein ACFZAE_26715 [Streptomyces scabiei]|uniref:hypothetical protein n=1 Tax=Streptomyces scabiei TaxID=1930 RepID=UPI0036EB6BE1
MQCLSLARVPERWAGGGGERRYLPDGRAAPVAAGRPPAQGPGSLAGEPRREHRFE